MIVIRGYVQGVQVGSKSEVSQNGKFLDQICIGRRFWREVCRAYLAPTSQEMLFDHLNISAQ